jgi:hypothetical protein
MIQRIAALVLLIGGVVRAASPSLTDIEPAGLPRGADADVAFLGQRLDDVRGLLAYQPGIALLFLKANQPGRVTARLRVAPDCPLGEHDFRVWTATGLSELMPLFIDPFPNVQCSGSNHTVARAQPVPINSTVNGVIQDEEIDYYSIQAKQGDRITAEVEGMRLGRDMFDPWAAILDAHGRQLASDDDNALLMLDPLVSIIAPAGGTYLVSIRESAWGGSPRSHYRLHIGNFPQPVAVYPPGGQAGQILPITFIGDVKGPIASSVRLPVDSQSFAADAGLDAPTPIQMRVSPFPNVLEQPPANDIAHATAGPPPPVAYNGIIVRPGDRGFFRFHAAAGAQLDMTVYARQLRSPLDSVLDVWDSTGKQLAENDDSIGPDSYLRFSVPADGDYFVSVRDQLNRGGPAFVYRLEVVPVAPTISFTVPQFVRDSQERQTVVIPRGNRFATMLRVTRDGFDGGFQLDIPGLPAGVTLETGSLAGQSMPVVFEAAPNAPASAVLADVLAQPPGGQPVGGYAQTVELAYGPPNDFAFAKANITRLAISVADEAPFRIELTPPDAPLLQNGQGNLIVTALRDPGFTGPITVSMLYNPPGVNSQVSVTIPGDQMSAELPIGASADAKPKTWQIAVLGSADAGHGTIWTSSALAPLTVSRPFVSGHLDRANAVRGQSVAITCHLTQMIPFAGTAHIRLMGLPPGTSAPDIDVTSADKLAVFSVTTDPSTPLGQHRDLFCEVTVQKNGMKMVANTAFGGSLRIDAPPPGKEVAAQ